MAGLGGGSNQNDTLDLMEIVAMLLIPTLIKAANEDIAAENDAMALGDIVEEEMGDEINDEEKTKEMEAELVGIPHKLIETVLNVILSDVCRAR